MSVMSLLAALPAGSETKSQEEMVTDIYQAAQNLPAGGLRLILLVSIVSLVGILWLVHRQQKLARNQVKLAGILEEMSARGGK